MPLKSLLSSVQLAGPRLRERAKEKGERNKNEGGLGERDKGMCLARVQDSCVLKLFNLIN